MSLKNIDELQKAVVKLEDALEQVKINFGDALQKTFMDALRENTSLNENAIYRKWLEYNAENDNLEV